MFRLTLFTVLLVAIVGACHSGSENTNNAFMSSGTDNSMTSVDWSGVYYSELPCADCEAIQTTLILRADLTYKLESRHKGKNTYTDHYSGSFEWTSSGNSIVLLNLDPAEFPTLYKIGENKIWQLDLQGNQIQGELQDFYILHKDISNIKERYWQLISMNGKPINMQKDPENEAHIIFKAIGNRIVGHGGCNSFSGTYELSGNYNLRFGTVASTRMACMFENPEDDFFALLNAADSYTLSDTLLVLKRSSTGNQAEFKWIDKKLEL
jgi:copper homeostasis protein (lipoprotein)